MSVLLQASMPGPVHVLTPKRKPPTRLPTSLVTQPGYAELYSRARSHHTTTTASNVCWEPTVQSVGADGRQDPERPATAPAAPRQLRQADDDISYGSSYMPYFRQRLARQEPAGDAAGLLTGGRFHGRSNPALGPGMPRPDQHYEPPLMREHHKTWHPQHSHLLMKRDIIGQAGYEGVPPASARPSKRTFAEPMARKYHLRGTGVAVEAQPEMQRKARGWGTRAPYTLVNTAARTMGAGPALTADDVDPLPIPGAHHKRYGRKVDLAHPGDHPDVLRYRFSRGVCPQQYKLDARRTPGPQVTPKVGEFLSKAYHDSHNNYQLNRAHAEGITEILFHHEKFEPTRLQYA